MWVRASGGVCKIWRAASRAASCSSSCGHDPGDHTESQRLGGVEAARREDQVARDADADVRGQRGRVRTRRGCPE